MRHLALPFFCAVVVGLLLALLAWALRNQVDAVALACAIGAVFFAWRCWEDLQTTWPAFKAEMQRRTAEAERLEALAALCSPTSAADGGTHSNARNAR
ncbi:hypothetical protein ACSYAO_002590 [Stenotrophomonas sp. STK16_22]|uniref:hypothetical protein n=1 Tax=Stenotrophomonas sp. STK16_22 TaxID=3395906 RepID=UPI003F7F46B6